MKILGFATNEGLRLGVVEGDNVIDLQAVDAKVPTNLADVLAQSNGDLKPLADLAKRAPAAARKPLKGIKHALPVARPPKIICLGLNYMEHIKEGFMRDNVPKFPTIFMRCQTSLVPHGQPILRPKVTETLDYEGRDGGGHRQAGEASHDGERLFLHRRLFGLQRRSRCVNSAQDHAVGHGQEISTIPAASARG